MAIKISREKGEPTASVELMITRSLPDYDLEKIEAPVPRDVDPILASEGFKDLLDDARATLEHELAHSGLEIMQLTGAICRDENAYHPGIWLVLREQSASEEMSAAGFERVAAIAEAVGESLELS
jgi:hypothetical protein